MATNKTPTTPTTPTDHTVNVRVGDRIRLVRFGTRDPYTHLKEGKSEGVIIGFWTDDTGFKRVSVQWDEDQYGRTSTLSLILGVDEFSKV